MAQVQEFVEKYAPENELVMVIVTTCTTIVIARIIYYISQALSPLVSSSYLDLKPALQADWNGRTVSTIHAILTSYLAYHVLFVDPQSSAGIFKDPIHYSCGLGSFTLAIVNGYILTDTWIMWAYRREISSANTFIVHHVIVIVGCVMVWSKNATLFYALVYTVTEASNPFVNLRWWLYSAQMQNTKLYLLVGLAMTISFTLGRILLAPIVVFYSYYHVSLQVLAELPWPEFTVAVLLPAAGNLLNSYWFILIARGLYKVLFPPSTKQMEAAQQEEPVRRLQELPLHEQAKPKQA